MGRVGRDWEDWEEWGEIGKLGFRSCFHSFPISSPSSRSPWSRIPPQTQLGKGCWAQWEEPDEWEEREEREEIGKSGERFGG